MALGKFPAATVLVCPLLAGAGGGPRVPVPPVSSKTPLVAHGTLHEPGQDASIAVESPAWAAWLADESHRSFHFSHPAGEFTARRERKQRGQTYWVAYRQAHNTLFKQYLGKSEALTQDHMITIAAALAARCRGAENIAPPES